MIKALLMISTVFIVSNCASSMPEPDPVSLDPEIATLAENSESPGDAELRGDAEPPEEEKLICRKERITGSHRVTKTCLTQEQIDRGRRDSRAYIDRIKTAPGPLNSDG